MCLQTSLSPSRREIVVRILEQLWHPFIQTYDIKSEQLDPRNRTEKKSAAGQQLRQEITIIQKDLSNVVWTLLIDDYGVSALELISAIQSHCERMDKDLYPVYLGFCRKFQAFFNRPNTLLDIPALKEQLKPCYQSVFRFYLTRCVGQQVSSVLNWSRPTTRCTCRDCAGLNYYLQNPSQQTYQVALSKRGRQHLHQRLGGMRYQGTHITRRPQDILVITKTDHQRAKHEAWLQKCKAAHSELQGFDQTHLRELLGDAAYEDLITMRHIITNRANAPRFLPTPRLLLETSTQTMQGQKRKAENEAAARVRQRRNLSDIEVVDLCDSD